MRKSSYLSLPAAALLALSPVQPAAAQDGNTLLKAIVGGVITGIVVNELTRDRDRGRERDIDVFSTQNRPLRPAPPEFSVTGPAVGGIGGVRDVQRALTFFGFDAGPVDGVLGAQTEAAVRGYQQWMGYPVTGRLSERGHAALLAAWSEARAGVGARIYYDSMGPRALLEPARLEALNNPPEAAPAPVVPPPVVTGPGRNLPAPPREIGPAPSPAPAPATGGTEVSVLPPPQAESGSLAGFCAHPSVAGLNVTLATMNDPRDALDQSFCQARAAAIARSDALAREVANVSARQIAGQCAQLGPVMEPHLAALEKESRARVVTGVREFAQASGTDREALARTARICLGTGYDDEQLEVALGAALLLVALDEPAYGELLGHHLYHGFGVARSEPKALEWWLYSTDEVAAGADPGFGRNTRQAELVDAAVYRLSQGPLR